MEDLRIIHDVPLRDNDVGFDDREVSYNCRLITRNLLRIMVIRAVTPMAV